jgi:adenylosuccinate synthase
VARRALRVADLFQRERFAAKLGEMLDFHNFVLQHYFKLPAGRFPATLDEHLAYGRALQAAGRRRDADAAQLREPAPT